MLIPDLVTEIVDSQPFDVNRKQARQIVDCILETIIKGLKRDGKVVIKHFGTFYLHTRPAYNFIGAIGIKRKFLNRTTFKAPPKTMVKFKYAIALYRSLADDYKGKQE